jgi:hypothetical protein
MKSKRGWDEEKKEIVFPDKLICICRTPCSQGGIF